MQLKAYLKNAYKISYEQHLNETWDAAFSLPFDDEKRLEIIELDFVEIFDQDKRIGMFRIMPNETERNEEEKTIRYKCEHVLSTLLDDVLFGYHQLSNHTTVDVLEYILSKQEVKRWKLGTVDFKRYFHYGWENENTLLGPLLSIPKPFNESYQWTWDDTTYPWTLNLVRANNEITGEIRYRKNLRGIRKSVDPSNIMTRIYPLGYGEGVNQLTVKDVNPTGKNYLEAPANIIEKYGMHKYIWVDRRFTVKQSLYDSAKALLDERCVPKVTYEVEAVDYELIDPYKLEKYEIGKLVRVHDEDLGILEDVRIVRKGKSDVTGNPLDVTFDIANKTEDLGTTQADIEKRQQINEVYSQGSTNILNYSYNDNCDSENPAVIKFFLPDDLVNINTLELTYETEEFRTYGATTESTPTEIKTSSSGGGTVTSTSAGGEGTYTSSAGGQTITSTSSGGQSSITSESGGQASVTSESGGQGAYTSNSGGGTTQTTDSKIFGEMWIESDVPTSPDFPYHRHVLKFSDQFNHGHSISIAPHSHAFSLPSHSHTVSLPSHKHEVKIQSHTHDVTISAHQHQVTLPSHKHDVTISPHDHTVEIPSHRHDISHGIFRLNQMPSKVTIKVDGNPIPATSVSGENIDLISYLSKGNDGKIERGKWHEVEILPDKLGRINANIISRLFISSNIGGNF
ncbi:phage tail spike protein [Bacillus cereus]|uniref:phage tail spike protein n=1 Tax=Bacillus cereus TaxID=1396 RepID=UPI001E5B170A|nr:phage tail spike protein [Bacillus cereus]MCD1206022.1 phage tail protein [Bacillus cereus]HDR4551262.1 phage tail protein [Bacillus cereus]